MTYEKADVKITVFDNIEFMVSSGVDCDPVGNSTIKCTGFSCTSFSTVHSHKAEFTCGVFDEKDYSGWSTTPNKKYYDCPYIVYCASHSA